MNINLLPWREKEQKQRYFILLFGFIGITVMLLITGWLLLHSYAIKTMKLQKINNQLNHRLHHLNKDPQLITNKKRYQTIQTNQTKQKRGKRYWQILIQGLKKITQTLPQNITLTSLIISNQHISLDGKANNIVAINHYLHRLRGSFLQNISLVKITVDKLFKFKITLNI